MIQQNKVAKLVEVLTKEVNFLRENEVSGYRAAVLNLLLALLIQHDQLKIQEVLENESSLFENSKESEFFKLLLDAYDQCDADKFRKILDGPRVFVVQLSSVCLSVSCSCEESLGRKVCFVNKAFRILEFLIQDTS